MSLFRHFPLLLAVLAVPAASATAQALPPDTLAVLVDELRLGLQLAVPASFRPEPRPVGPPDLELTQRLTQLLGPAEAATASVVLAFTQRTAPHSTLTVVHLPASSVPWLSWGFEAWRPGRFYRCSSTLPLAQELACALPDGGWLYLRAQVPAAAVGPDRFATTQLIRTLDILYGSRIFPALRLGATANPSTAAQLARYADSLAHHAPGGNPLPALGALREARHAAAAHFGTPAEAAANPDLSTYQLPYTPRVRADLWYLGDAFDKLESWVSAPTWQRSYTNGNLDFLTLPKAEYFTDGTFTCLAGTVFSTREALPELLAQARGKRAVLLNESVYRPQHRTLLALALPGLYAQGFRYLAIRSLTAVSGGLNQPYPALPEHEFAPDFQFANLVRSARQLGFTLIGYADTTLPTGLRQNWPQDVSAALDQEQWTQRYRPVSPLRPALDALPAGAKVVVLAPGLEPRREPTPGVPDGRPGTIPLLGGWGGRAVLVVEQLQMEGETCLNFADLNLPAPHARPDSLARPDLARAIYVQYAAPGPAGLTPRRPLPGMADLNLYNRLDASRLPLPYPYATNAHRVQLALTAYRSTPQTGRRVLQLYLADELQGPRPDQVPPVFTHEIGPTDQVLALQLCPGRYRYVIRSTASAAPVWADLVVAP